MYLEMIIVLLISVIAGIIVLGIISRKSMEYYKRQKKNKILN